MIFTQKNVGNSVEFYGAILVQKGGKIILQQPEKYAEKERPAWVTANLPESGKNFIVLMERQQTGDVTGTIHNLFLEKPQQFNGFADAILKMDAVMDELENPQSGTEPRSFWMKPELQNDSKAQRDAYYEWLNQEKKIVQQYWKSQAFQPKDTKRNRAMFYITVRFRQHSSWQGDVAWRQRKRAIKFRSVLELLHLLQSALLRDMKGEF